MRKLTLGLISLLFMMVACSQDHMYETEPIEGNKTKTNHYYGVKRSERKNTKGIAQRNNLWSPSTVITVKFMNEPATHSYPNNDIITQIVRYAKEWEKHAGITFKFVNEGDAMIRIGFNWNEDRYVTWSYIGTDAKMVTDQNEATASFADFDDLGSVEQRGEVLRLFGQILGLELEHRHLAFDAGWKNRVQNQWEGDIADIPWETLKKYVFDPLETSNVVMTEDYDPSSIMIWPFPRTVATNTEREFNFDLSENDKVFIAELYPKTDGRIFEGIISGGSSIYSIYYLKYGFKINYQSQNAPLIVQWDDEEKVNFGYNFEGYITSNASKTRSDQTSIRIYGDAEGIIEFNSDATSIDDDYTQVRGLCLIGEYNFSKFVNLKKLDFRFNGGKITFSNNYLVGLVLIADRYNSDDQANYPLTGLPQLKNLKLVNIAKTDFSANTGLEELELSSYSNPEKSNYHFDFSRNNNLKTLTIRDDNKITTTTINLSQNDKLKILNLNIKNMTQLDVSKNTKLKNLSIQTASFNQLDISKNIELEILSFGSSEPYELDLSVNTALESIGTGGPLTKITLSKDKNQKLKYLYFEGSHFTELNLSNSTFLEELWIMYSSNLKEVDVSNNKYLKRIEGTHYDSHINFIGWPKTSN